MNRSPEDPFPPAVPAPPGSGSGEGAHSDDDPWPVADRRAEFARRTAESPSPPGDLRAFLENRVATILSAPDLSDEEKAAAVAEVRGHIADLHERVDPPNAT